MKQTNSTSRNLAGRDQKCLWHPLTQHKRQPKALGIVRAKGARLYDATGKSYIDGIASWYIAVYGHCNPEITDAVYAQMQQLDQIVFSGFTHEPAIALAETLLPMLPGKQEKLFFSDNGSTSVEVALKMCLQFHHNQGRTRNTIIAFESGFHGDTFGAMSVSGLSVYNGSFESYFIPVKRIPLPIGPNNDAVLKRLKKLIQEEEIAGFIYEPLVQGAAGMKMYDAKGLSHLIAYCKANEVLTIADEVMTGFGKTGTYFASEQLTETPDMICLSKALTAGLIPMAVTSCTANVYNAFYDDALHKGFFHGHTYTANPLACSAALAGLKILQSETMQTNIQRIIQEHQKFDQRIASHPLVASTRQIGMIYALDLSIELERYGRLRDQMFNFFMDQGVFLRPLGGTIYLHPPYIISSEDLARIYQAIEALLHSLKKTS